ncbi:Integrase zinc binding domain [Popillia japonica]|uniref:Integrase zinc binding domain n=1 Tax=Popillia japonica TaxID=7064 RepID=A0AAW1JZ14_POPJA
MRVVELAHRGHHTKQLIRSKVWFQNIDKITEERIKACVACQAVDNTKRRDPIIVRDLPNTPFHSLDMDFAGPFPNGKYIFIIIDEYSRFPIAEIVDSTSFEQIQPILEKTFALMGIPKMVLQLPKLWIPLALNKYNQS